MSDNNKPLSPLTIAFWVFIAGGLAFFGYLNLKNEKPLGAQEVENKRWEDKRRQDELNKDIKRASSEAYGR